MENIYIERDVARVSTLTRGERSNRGADEFAVPRFRARRVYLVRFLPDFRDPLLHFSSND